MPGLFSNFWKDVSVSNGLTVECGDNRLYSDFSQHRKVCKYNFSVVRDHAPQLFKGNWRMNEISPSHMSTYAGKDYANTPGHIKQVRIKVEGTDYDIDIWNSTYTLYAVPEHLF